MARQAPSRESESDTEARWRRGVVLFGLVVVGASFVLYAMSGQTSSILVGAGVALVGTGLSPQLAQLLIAPKRYEPPPETLPDPEWRDEEAQWEEPPLRHRHPRGSMRR